ncbi:hypothetical protein KBY58_04620 [Cyanobium sp. HWJ4-Hawea]|uniref:hypothetical protein n=1 Tax=Cyanobium sp. HWJ4-Hawea TaxID=2823713 RepID=UPI0020CB6BDB|nr:hypothetical protein [Cyanobium sp. HWJ4-Hawea]MCP9808713.1 hypothetical protein [Cyanobium sp. HWJ4-Hawea]
MSFDLRRSSHLSRLLESLRLERGLRPGQLASILGASNSFKVGSLIRSFELGGPITTHWLEKLVVELQPNPSDLARCLELDQQEAELQLEQDRLAWESWADEPIEPFLTIRYMPAVYGVREVPKAFCTPRENPEDREWARERAEDWAAAELKRFRGKGFLNWSRRERTWFDERGINPQRRPVTFEGRAAGAWMQLSGSQQKFLLDSSGKLITQSYGLDHPC